MLALEDALDAALLDDAGEDLFLGGMCVLCVCVCVWGVFCEVCVRRAVAGWRGISRARQLQFSSHDPPSPLPSTRRTQHQSHTRIIHTADTQHTHASHTQQKKKQHSALHLVAKVGAGRHVCTIGGAGLQHALRLVERRERRVERLTQRDERVGDDDADEAAEAEEWTGREEREEGGAVASTRGAFL